MRRGRAAQCREKEILQQGDTRCTSLQKWHNLRQIAGLCAYCLVWCCAYASVLACLILVTVVIATANAAASDKGIFNHTATSP